MEKTTDATFEYALGISLRIKMKHLVQIFSVHDNKAYNTLNIYMLIYGIRFAGIAIKEYVSDKAFGTTCMKVKLTNLIQLETATVLLRGGLRSLGIHVKTMHH